MHLSVVGKLQLADFLSSVALLAEQQYLKLIVSYHLIFNVCFIYQHVYMNSSG